MNGLRQWLCRHEWRNGETQPPYKPPYCAKCGKVLAMRAGITYGDFMALAQRVLGAGVNLSADRIETGSITAKTVAIAEREERPSE